MLRQQFRFRQRLKRLQSSDANDSAQRLAKLEEEIHESVALREQRRTQLPKPVIDQSLPIADRQHEIIAAVRDHQVVVISGATGSGKSTQLPPMLLDAGFGVSGLIGHTQPRRIAARGVAARVAQQLGTPLGTDVGFKIRFADQTSPKSYIKLMTDGILLAESQSDRFLEQYEVIIVDEAHERSLNIDFLLGYLKRVLSKRSDFRLVITSATIDTQRFAEHFTTDPDNPVPIIEVEGRTYPVEIQYEPPSQLADGSPREVEDHVVSVCEQLAKDDDGDMLVFLPTERDIRSVSKKLRGVNFRGRTEILPLYARLSTDQQNLIFQPGAARRVVLATNVAESSITVPRIRFVVDTGTARISHYAARSKVQRLPIQAISQASADQRAGRCGRIGPGVCVRLYDEEDFASRPKFTTPEIRRTNLASVILQTLSLKLGHIDQFPFIDPPRAESIRDGFKTLFEIGAVDEKQQLTELGRRLARMPVDPRIGRMVFAADDENCLSEILIIASALEIQDPRVRPVEKQKAADAQHERFLHETSDFLSLLNIWDFFHQLKDDLSRSKLKKACQQNFLSYPMMQQWLDIHRQLGSMVRDQKLKPRSRRDDSNAIHRSLLTGLLSGIALLTDRHEYTGAGNIKFNLWPGSGVFESKPKWIMAAEVVETTRRYGRTVAKISPDWIEPIAAHLTKHNYSDPYWSKKQQTVMATESVTLFGVPIVAGRRVGYAKIDPLVSRDLFIDHALVEDEIESSFDFVDHNRWLLEEITTDAAKTRNRELIVDRNNLVAFYQTKLPEDVADVAGLRRAIKANQELDQSLRLTRADVLPSSESADMERMFPTEAQIGSMEVPISYRFEPGAADDGASIKIPLAGIGQIDDVQTGWLIPGLMPRRIVALIRSLPKQVRRNLVPAPDTADRVAKQIEFGKGRFIESVAAELTRIGGLPIDESMFKLEKLDAHLNLNLQVIDETGELVAQGRSVGELRQQLGSEHVSTIVEIQDEQWQQDGLKTWTWDEFPKEIMITRGQTQLAAFPTIVDQGNRVGLRLSDSANASDVTTRQGLVRLFQLAHRKALKSQVNWLPELERHQLAMVSVLGGDDLKQELGDLICRIAFVDREKIPRDQASFLKLQTDATERIGVATQRIAKWLPKLSEAVHEVQMQLNGLPAKHESVQRDIEQQIKSLTLNGFLSKTPWQWLEQFPRYFAGILQRIEKLGFAAGGKSATEKELELSAQLRRHWERYQSLQELHQTQAIIDRELIQFRWMIEEFRVSLFAQQLGTVVKVSEVRLEKQWARVRKT